MAKRDSDDPKPLCPLHVAVTEAREETQAAALLPVSEPNGHSHTQCRQPSTLAPPANHRKLPRDSRSYLAFAKIVLLFAVVLECEPGESKSMNSFESALNLSIKHSSDLPTHSRARGKVFSLKISRLLFFWIEYNKCKPT